MWTSYNKSARKAAGREFFFRNEAHQPANIGARGAWTAGGLEFNWSPGFLGHSAFTEERVWAAVLATERGDVVRGVAQMTSPLGGGGGLPISDKREGGCVDLVLTRGEGVQNPKNLADVICERPLTMTHYFKSIFLGFLQFVNRIIYRCIH